MVIEDKRTVGQRLAAEVKRKVHYGPVAQELKRLGIRHTNFSKWKCGEADPQAYWLQQLALDGYDVLFILTGRRQYPMPEADFDICEYEEET